MHDKLIFIFLRMIDPPKCNPRVFRAGAATAKLTPLKSVFLFGYPHVPRLSTGIHDHLECTALYLEGSSGRGLFLANDLIFVGKDLVAKVRDRIHRATGLPHEAITITATHTHSGPVTVDYVSNKADTSVPLADQDYLDSICAQMVKAACKAIETAVPVEIGIGVAQVVGVGTNRHDPVGPADPDVPILIVRRKGGFRPLACMLVYAMHPTVLHEDSTLISGDFPHFTRSYLRDSGVLPAACPILYHNGASGNQSPRHVTTQNTFEEAARLGELLGKTIAKVIPTISYSDQFAVNWRSELLPLKLRKLPSIDEAEARAHEALSRLNQLRAEAKNRTEIRSAECDWFGAEETMALARAEEEGELNLAVQNCMPAEIQVIEIGPWTFVAWPGEFFVEYALQVKAHRAHTFVMTLANGELQGYIATEEAMEKGFYEATNALFCHTNGLKVVAATLAMLGARD